MELHTCLWNEVAAFDFSESDLATLKKALPQFDLIVHPNADSFLSQADKVEYLLTWEFPESWYELCPNIKKIMTPAAGQDWIAADPTGATTIVHGAFHGEIMAESLLSALLYMNHRMPLMIQNHTDRAWRRDLQKNSRLLRHQRVVIIGFGNIGKICGRLIRSTGAEVIGVRRSRPSAQDRIEDGIQVHTVAQLPEILPTADHVVLVLPGTSDTDNFLTADLIRQCREGVYLYNFGRGNALTSQTVIEVASHIGGAFLDVTEEEPLPIDSPLWSLPNVMITPHSSCIYEEYKVYFLNEVIAHLTQDTAA